MSKVYGFEEMSACPKCLCGRQFANVKWGRFQCADGPVPAMVLGAPGVLRVECNNCGFAWLEQPADAEPKAAGFSVRQAIDAILACEVAIEKAWDQTAPAEFRPEQRELNAALEAADGALRKYHESCEPVIAVVADSSDEYRR